MGGGGMRGPGLFDGDLGPGPGFGGMGGNDGMLLGPNHGAWGGRGGGGGGGGMPQPRFDPYGPGVPGQGPGQGPPGFFPPPGQGQMDPSNMGAPNNDHLAPPGINGPPGPKKPKDGGPPPGMYF